MIPTKRYIYRHVFAVPLAALLASCGGGGSSDSPSSDPLAPPSAEADPVTAADTDNVFLQEPRDADCRQSIEFYADFFAPVVDRLFIDGAADGNPSSETLFFATDTGEEYALVFEWGPGITGCRGTLA